MLHLNLKPILDARGISKPYSWLIQSGFPETAARRLSANDYRELPLHHLEKLCILLHCTPNDLLRWTPQGIAAEQHPLNALAPAEATGLEWMDELRGLPLDELRALGKKIKA